MTPTSHKQNKQETLGLQTLVRRLLPNIKNSNNYNNNLEIIIIIIIIWFGDNVTMSYDLMAQRLARRAEDRKVPGSSPTQN